MSTLTLSGDKALRRPVSDVWPRLVDLPFLVNCLPDLHAITSVDSQTAEAVLRPGFSFARSEMQLKIEKIEEVPPKSARFNFATKGIGSSSLVEARFDLVERDRGCLIQWSADVVQLGGLLKAVPSGLIQGGAEKVINDLLSRIEHKLNAAT